MSFWAIIRHMALLVQLHGRIDRVCLKGRCTICDIYIIDEFNSTKMPRREESHVPPNGTLGFSLPWGCDFQD